MNKELITSICENHSKQNGFMFIDLLFVSQHPQSVIELYVDKKGVLTIDDCAALSRLISAEMEETDIGITNFRLDVSSPGTERELKYLDQYFKHINRKLELVYKDENNSEQKEELVLSGIEEENLVFKKVNEEKKVIAFSSIISSKVLLKFS